MAKVVRGIVSDFAFAHFTCLTRWFTDIIHNSNTVHIEYQFCAFLKAAYGQTAIELRLRSIATPVQEQISPPPIHETSMTATADDIAEEMTRLAAADGFTLDAFHASPRQASKGGLVILQEIFGLTDQLKSVVRSYAADGYDTILPCLFDRVAPNTVVPFNEPNRGRDMAYGLALDKVMVDVAAAVHRVENDHGVSVLGFCWGGGVIVRAAAELNLKCAIAFYGTRLPTYLDLVPKCPLQFHFGATDPNSPPETIEAVRRAFPSAETYVYDAGHAFANDVRPVYVPAAAEKARERALAFLDRYHRVTNR